MSGSLLDQRMQRPLWTDILRERYYRDLVKNSEAKLETLRARPNTTPDQMHAEKVALDGVSGELRKVRNRLGGL